MRERPPEKFANKGKEKDKNEGKGRGGVIVLGIKHGQVESGDGKLFFNTLKEVLGNCEAQ